MTCKRNTSVKGITKHLSLQQTNTTFTSKAI